MQVDQVFRGYLSARLSVAQAEADLQTSLDAFKLRLGLPPHIPIDLDDSQLARFQLTPPELEKLREETANFQLDRFKELTALPTIASLKKSLEELRAFAKRAPEQLAKTERDLDGGFKRLDSPLRSGQDREQVQRTRQDYERFRKTLGDVRRDLETLPGKLDSDEASLVEISRRAIWDRINLHTRFPRPSRRLDCGSNSRQNQWIDLPELNDTEDEAVYYAHQNRLDLDERQGRAVTTPGAVTVAANARGDLNVVANANLANDLAQRQPVGFVVAAQPVHGRLHVRRPAQPVPRTQLVSDESDKLSEGSPLAWNWPTASNNRCVSTCASSPSNA